MIFVDMQLSLQYALTVHNWYSVLGDVGKTGKQAGGKVASFVLMFISRSQQIAFAHPHRVQVSVVSAL
jgi:hypothetical protein